MPAHGGQPEDPRDDARRTVRKGRKTGRGPQPAGPDAPLKGATSRDRQRRDTFVRVFDAAIAEFERVGVEKARVSDICHAAGVAKGTFFFHFATKDDVLLERQRHISEAMANRIGKELGEVATASAFIQRLVAIVLEEHAAVGDPELVRQINLAIVRRAGSPMLGAQHTAFGTALTAQIRQLVQAGVLRNDVDPVQLADCLRLSLFGFMLGPQFAPKNSSATMKLLGSLLGGALAP